MRSFYKLSFAVFVVFFVVFKFNNVFAASASDSTVLAELYESCGGKTWKNASNWHTAAPLGTWEGVTLNAQGRVVTLDLSSKGLSGGIPASLVKLSHLELLNLQNNLLTGFPSFQSHANPSQLAVFLSGNRLDFGDLEYNYKAVGQTRPKSHAPSTPRPNRYNTPSRVRGRPTCGAASR